MTKYFETNKLTSARLLLLVGLIYFVYSLSVGVAIQTYIVPKILPQLNFGEGIVTLDASGFNRIAKAKANEIRNTGWEAWELRPEALSPAGVASIFYALWTPKPYSLLPFNALIHALSGCLVLWILIHFFSYGPAIIGSALFVINPASLQWVAQIHRDGIFILGNLMVLACLMQFWLGLKSGKARIMMWGVIFGITGSALVWVARPYWNQVLMVVVLLGLFVISITRWTARDMWNEKKYPVYFILPFALALLVFQGWMVDQDPVGMGGLVNIPQDKIEIAQENTAIAQENVNVYAGLKPWRYTKWVPDIIERKLFQVANLRQGALSMGGNTVVDIDVSLNSIYAFWVYFPRAMQLGYLSPLPELWGGEGSTQTMTIARKVMGIVTLIFYVFLMGTIVGIYLFRKDPVIWLISIFCFIGILVFIYAYPNIGTFLRFRYGFYMLLIAFGAANIAELSFARFGKRYH